MIVTSQLHRHRSAKLIAMAATDMPRVRRFRPPGSRKKPYSNLRKGIEATFLNLGDALDNRTAMGKDYAAQLWREYHGQLDASAAYKASCFLLTISTKDFASRRATLRDAGTEVTRATISDVVVRIVI
jgi:hypothetical protein